MVKKSFAGLFLILMIPVFINAYNPPVGGENMYQFVSPHSLTGGNSVTGGALQNVAIEDIALNPSLIAGEQRFVLNLSGSYLFETGEESSDPGIAAQLGLIFPSRVGVAALDLQWINIPFANMNYGNSFTVRAAYAKDLIDDLYVGLALYGTFGDDWAVGGDLGFWCNVHTVKWLPFLKDVRWAFAFTNLGRAYKGSTDGLYSENITGFPSPFTPRFGIAGSFVKAEKIQAGISLDISLPSFQNVVASTALQFVFFNFVNLKAGWEINARECAETKVVMIPAVALSFKFNFTASKKDDSFIAKQGWTQSEMDVSAAYKYVQDDLHVTSAEVIIYPGQKDTVAPEINLWEEDNE